MTINTGKWSHLYIEDVKLGPLRFRLCFRMSVGQFVLFDLHLVCERQKMSIVGDGCDVCFTQPS